MKSNYKGTIMWIRLPILSSNQEREALISEYKSKEVTSLILILKLNLSYKSLSAAQ